ncbi:hypothetical protein Syun_019750 [Stephania yunnanensis]|uniref:Uncharacterized protein n=1 Tax=Stephania yunnanensis TaxID=152371 RepID=A0AAP0IWD6_9MAGN
MLSIKMEMVIEISTLVIEEEAEEDDVEVSGFLTVTDLNVKFVVELVTQLLFVTIELICLTWVHKDQLVFREFMAIYHKEVVLMVLIVLILSIHRISLATLSIMVPFFLLMSL